MHTITGTTRRLIGATVASALFAIGVAAFPSTGSAGSTLNVLGWCDIADAKIIEPFEKANDVKINFKDVDSTAAALAILGQSKPGDWDVLMSDGADTSRIVAKGLLSPLNPADYPMDDLFPVVKEPVLTSVDGKFYMVPLGYGYHGLAFNSDKIDPKDVQEMAAAWDPKFKGRLGIYDYYIPQVALAALAIGKDPATLGEADLPAIKEKLIELKKNSVLVGDVATTQQALATGTIDLLVGADSTFTAGFAAEKPNLTYSVPNKGVVRWQTGLAQVAGGANVKMATKFIQYMLTPEAQARISTSACFWSLPANMKTSFSPEEAKIMQWDQQAERIAASHNYPILNADLDKKLQDLWTEVLQAN